MIVRLVNACFYVLVCLLLAPLIVRLVQVVGEIFEVHR